MSTGGLPGAAGCLEGTRFLNGLGTTLGLSFPELGGVPGVLTSSAALRCCVPRSRGLKGPQTKLSLRTQGPPLWLKLS